MSDSNTSSPVGTRPPYRGYFALVLTEESKAALAARYATLPEVICHHLTVRFGTDDPADLPEAFGPSDLGASFALKVIGFKTREDSGIQAVAVALLRDGQLRVSGISANTVPHITVALNPALAKPVQSNALLEAGYYPVEEGPELTAVLRHVR